MTVMADGTCHEYGIQLGKDIFSNPKCADWLWNPTSHLFNVSWKLVIRWYCGVDMELYIYSPM
jgi:hypothetical protein